MAKAKRKLTAILCADVVAFSRLMEADETATVRMLKDNRLVLRDEIERHGGRTVDAPGDALLADFASAIDAVHCAIAVQEILVDRNAALDESRRMAFRIGINMGDVLEEDGALFGDGVNIAARVQALADPGGLCISGKVFDEVDGRVRAQFEFIGEKKVKNLAKPVRAYQWARPETLTLRFLGEMRVFRGRDLVPLPPSKKTRILLAYLAVTGRPHRRDRLCDLLWDVPDDPRGALRWSLSKLRPIVDEPERQRIIADRNTVAFEAHGASVDVTSIRERLANGLEPMSTQELEDMSRQLEGTFLEGMDLTGFLELSTWCATERAELSNFRLAVLRVLVERLSDDPRRALPYARALAQAESGDDEAQNALRRLQQSAQAEATPPASSLEAETVPPAITAPASAPGAPQDSRARELSIAVLPFDILSPDQTQDHFADGIMEDLITALSKISELLVIARNSTAPYKGQSIDPVRAAAELGVRYVVQGSFRRSGQRIRVTTQLIDARGGRTLWADRYDRDLEDIFAVQDDITKEIVTALEVKLTLGEQARLWHRHARSMEAYEEYLRGLECYNRFTKASNRQAKQHFENAIARSPDFAAAYHYLGWVHMTDGWFRWSADPDASLTEALVFADKAIGLDDTHADGYAVRAFVHTLRGQHDRAAEEAERAVALNPGAATVCHMLALVRLFGGDPEEAASLERQALRLSPLVQDNYLVVLGHAYCMAGRFDEAVEVLEQVRRSKPYWLTVHTLLAFAYNELGRAEEARDSVEEVVRLNPQFSLLEWEQLLPYRRAADLQRHMDALRRAGLPDRAPATSDRSEPTTTETKYARSGDVNIAYQVGGRSAPDLVFVPGWVSHIEYAWEEPSFAPFLERLKQFSRLILLDRRGTGLSDPVHDLPTLEERMDDLRAVMDASSSERAYLLGISESGPMCTLFAATYPDRTAGLILCNTFARAVAAEDHPWATSAASWETLRQMVDAEWGTGMTARVFAPSRAKDEAFVRSWGRFERRAVSKGAMRTILAMAMNTDVRDVLPSIRVPTLVVHRVNDRATPIEGGRYLAEHIPGARLVEIPGADHFPWVGNTDLISDAVEEFVTGARPASEVDRVLTTILCAEAVGLEVAQLAKVGDRWTGLKAVLRREVEHVRGREIESGNGSLLAAFDGPARAIRCAGAICAAGEASGVAIRAGLHTGECIVAGTQLSGVAVQLAAGVCREASPGEILVSSTVTDLVAGSGLRFTERGTRTLRGVPGEWRLYAALV